MAPVHERNVDFRSTMTADLDLPPFGYGHKIQLDTTNVTYQCNALIRKMQRFSDLSEDHRVVLAGLTGAPQVIEPGTDLCHETDAQDGILVITAGFACRYKLRSNNARQITDYLLPGDHCDLKTVSRKARSYVAALAPSKVARISSETLSSVQRDYPAIGEAFRKSALVESAILREWLMNMGRRSADERLSHLFCELFERMHAVGLVQDNSFRLPLTQFDLGDTMGLSYVHVNRTLKSLRQQGLFTLSSKTLTILDPDGLRKLAEFEPSYLLS